MKKLTILSNIAFLIASIVVYAYFHCSVTRTYKGSFNRIAPASLRWNLSPTALKIIAGEFKGIVSDFLILEAGAELGKNLEPEKRDWKSIILLFQQALVLDPYFQEAYMLVQGFIPWEAKKPKTAISLLSISDKHRSWDWFPSRYIGFDYYYFLGDYGKASEIFLETAKRKGAPIFFALLGARFALKGQRTTAAIQMLLSMLKDPGLDDEKREEIKKRLEALKGVSLLERSVNRYHKKYGRYPSSLSDLIDKGFLQHMPVNPYGGKFFLNPETGEISFDKVKAPQVKTR